MELLSEVRDIGKEQDGEFSSGIGELMSVQHRNEHFQEVLGYIGLKLCHEYRSIGRYLGVMDGIGDSQNRKCVCVCVC